VLIGILARTIRISTRMELGTVMEEFLSVALEHGAHFV